MMIEIPIDILYDLFGNDLKSGMARLVPGNVVLELKALPIQNRMVIHDASPPIPVHVTITGDASIGVFADWLYEQLLRFNHRRLVINGRWVEAQPDEILGAITRAGYTT
jgi:hypothetical protein